MTGGSINLLPGSDNSQAVHADINAMPVLNNVAITTDGANSVGALARTFEPGNTGTPGGFASGIITLNNGSSITTNGANSTGVLAAGAGIPRVGNSPSGAPTGVFPPSQIILDGTAAPIDITTNGMNSTALAVCSCSQVAFSDPNFGPTFVQMVGGTITATNTNVTTTAAGSTGVSAQDGGTISLTNSTVTVEGNDGSGYFVNGIGINGVSSNITATNTVAQTTGTNSPGGLLTNGGTLTIDRGSVTTTGAGSDAFLFMPVTPVPTMSQPVSPGISAGDPTAPNTLNINAAMVSSAADAFHVIGVPADINISGSTVTGNNGVLLSTESGGTTNLTDTGSTLTGAILTEGVAPGVMGTAPGGSTANVSLTSDTWNMSGSSTMTSLAENGSTINFAPPAPGADLTALASYKTLTANVFTGNAGEINMNTFLGADSSPSDRIVINEMATATTPVSLFIHNTIGPGAPTTMNGILVVQADPIGTTQPGMFVLDNPELRGGAFTYELFRGGINGTDPNDWFLRNVFVAPPEPPEPPTPGVPPGPELPTTPPPMPLPPGEFFPIIGPELATYGVVQPIARQMGLSTLGTYHERVGDAAADAACLNAPPDDLITKENGLITKAPPVPYGNCHQWAVWGRVFGQQINDHYEAFADPRASGQVAGIQSGVDLWRGSLIPGHTDVAGVYFAYGNANVTVDGLVTNPALTAFILERTGFVNLNAYSAGGYWTHTGPGGWYVDTVLQGSFYSGNATTQFANLPINGTGFISSVEAGYPIPLPVLGPGFVLEPEAQVIFQQVSFGDANDGLGPVGLGTTSGFTERFGLRGKWIVNDAAGRLWQPYVLANVWRDSGADATTTFGGDLVPLLEKATRLEFAGGVSARILPGLTLYGQAGYQFAVSGTDGGTRDGIRADLGVHYAW